MLGTWTDSPGERTGCGPGVREQLEQLSDDQIIEFSVRRRDSGDPEGFRCGIRFFVARRLPMVEGLVARRVPEPEHRAEIVQEVLVSALASIHHIRGSHPGEIFNWLKTIISYRISDHFTRLELDRRRQAGDGSPVGDEDDAPLFELVDAEDEIGAVATLDAISRVLAGRSPQHQRAIKLRMAGHPSIRVSEILEEYGTMSPTNIDQVFSRFRKDMHEELFGNDE